jgi:uncharacterized protein (TIGR02246 family)
MNTRDPLFRPLLLALLGCGGLFAEEPSAEIAGLQQAAADFVEAYNSQNAAALAQLFTQDGEMTNLTGDTRTTGHEEIQARYEEIFAENPHHIAIEVDSVRLVAPNLAIEDGTFHLTPAEDESAPPQSHTYTATLLRNEAGEWKIASSRTLQNVTDASGQLATLADVLLGDWTYRSPDGIRLDLSFGWDPSGKFLLGEMITTTASGDPQQGSVRIGWDHAKKHITSWMFDARGGFTHGTWSATEDGWVVRSEGSTADGEALSASQHLTQEDPDSLLWASQYRLLNGEKAADTSFRLVRQAPEPAQPAE